MAIPDTRLIESAFPLRQVSRASVHEKSVRHGHVSTLHVWPARRPLAASRAAVLAALLPAPGDEDARRRLLARMAAILPWGGEDPAELARFRAEVRAAFGGRAPRVLDPFAGGGAIPLEAMRLGCAAEAADLNPVAWFLLRCTLHWPRALAGARRPLPGFALRERAFAEAFLKAQGVTGKGALRAELDRLGHGDGAAAQLTAPDLARRPPAEAADAAWHLRAWGRRVLARARRDLAARYPTWAEFEPRRRKGRRRAGGEPRVRYRPRAPRLLAPDAEGRVSAAALNAEFDSYYLEQDANPRWVAKPAVAYLWARTVRCRDCRAEIPLLKTGWLCRKGGKRVGLRMTPADGGAGVVIGVETAGDADGGAARAPGDAKPGRAGGGARDPGGAAHDGTSDRARDGGGAARARDAERDAAGARGRPLGAGTMSRSGASCPVCGSVTTMADLRAAGRAGRLGARLTAVVVDGQQGKEYRPPAAEEIAAARVEADELDALYAGIPFGCEVNPLSERTGGFPAAVEWVARVVERLDDAAADAPAPAVVRRSATAPAGGPFDLICTDPPYYDAIPYSDLMDFFHVWLRRALRGLSPAVDAAFAEPRGPKWDAAAGDGELIDDAARFAGDRAASKRNYEEGMARAFVRFRDALRDDGRLVLVFANKSPDAWETLVSALVRSGFVVTGSWPIRTEMETRQRSFASAALSASIWLVCRRRPAAARQGWDGKVLAAMEASITARLRGFWDAGIRGPDFVWAATGPALEAFSRHPVVKKADAPGERLTVAEFLRRVRRMVVGFVVSRLLDQRGGATADLDDPSTYYLLHRADFGLAPAPAGACILYALSCNVSDADLAGRLDLLARGGRAAAADDGADADDADVGDADVGDAAGDAGHPPAASVSGAGVAGGPDAETAAAGTAGGPGAAASEDAAAGAAGARGGGASGGEVRLKPWRLRRARGLGEPAADGTPPPLVDCLHKLMQLWKTGELRRVDAYLEARGLRRHELFARVTQAIVELAERGSDERALLESIQNHLRTGAAAPAGTMRLDFGGES